MTKHEPMGEECSVCDEEWPCDAYRRTKNYRIEVLENEVRQLKVQFYRRIEESPKAWLEYDNRLKAMETYNQRLYDQGRRITKLESSSEKTGCGVTEEDDDDL